MCSLVSPVLSPLNYRLHSAVLHQLDMSKILENIQEVAVKFLPRSNSEPGKPPSRPLTIVKQASEGLDFAQRKNSVTTGISPTSRTKGPAPIH